MATQIERVVDAHVHLWDPARTDWYPYLSGGQELNMGDISGMCRYFDQDIYFSESAKWNVEKFVHVAAATGTVQRRRDPGARRARAKPPGTPTPSSAASSPASPSADTIESARRADGVVPRSGVSVDGRRYRRRVPNVEVLGALRRTRPGLRLHGPRRRVAGCRREARRLGRPHDRGRTRRLAADEHRRGVRDVEGGDGDAGVAGRPT